jgi:acetyltransferase-like isoleucine patch superfamily enzyme
LFGLCGTRTAGLDVCQVKVGGFTLFGPGVQIYTAAHPMNADLRRKKEFVKPIEIEVRHRCRKRGH